MIKQLVCALVIVFLTAFNIPIFASSPAGIFADVPLHHWAYAAIQQLIDEGVLAGYDQGYLHGSRPVTRYEMAIIAGNAMTKMDKANERQKDLIQRLAAEFQPELEKFNGSVDKAESDQKKLQINIVTRIQYTHTSLTGNRPGGALGGGTFDHSDPFSERVRITFSKQVNDDWNWVGRMHQDNFNFQNGSYGSGAEIDLFYLTGNILGGKAELGRMYLYPGKGGFINRDYKADLLAYSTYTADKKLWFRTGTGYSEIPALEPTKSTDLSFGEVKWQVNRTTDIGAYYYQQNRKNGVEDVKVYSVNGAYRLPNTKLTLVGEWARNEAAPFKGKTGYWLGLNSGYDFSYWSPALVDMVNSANVGSHGWGLTYRHMPSGVAGANNSNAYATWSPWCNDKSGQLMNAIDNVNAIRFDYQWVPMKGLIVMTGYDKIKPIDQRQDYGVFYCNVNFNF